MTRRAQLLTCLALIGLAVATFVALGVGYVSGSLTWSAAWPWALDAADPTTRDILLSIRLPRVASAVIVGAALASSGAVLQSVSRNPLADPYLLGVSGGAGLAMVIVHGVFRLSDVLGWWVVPGAAFAGGQLATLAVLRLARGQAGRITVLGIILGGVILNAFCAALMTFFMVRFDPNRLRVTSLWLAGGLGSETWPRIAAAALLTAGAIAYLWTRAPRLNAFAIGSDGASSVGVDTAKEIRWAAAASSVLAGVGVSLAGLLGYVGLLVPHLARRIVGPDLRLGLPFAAVIGALLLVLADTVARTAAAPQEMPVGVIAALAGCPVLLVLLRREIQR